MVVCVSIPIHQWKWRVSDSRRIDGIDLPSLVSFCVDGDSCIYGSFRFAQFIMTSVVVLVSLGIDLPSLKSIHVEDGCFCGTPHVKMISEDELKQLARRSSSAGIVMYWLICLSGRQQAFSASFL